ncbi:hypothetical protein A9K55_008060 [Cordyceps militaris]|uniref:Uncharacterized protein n=1 Tax=Cordyceps militaris TaxID=73501 RepID=A0A2H4SHM8_CORMI|nr:hypothetical protein A9K55_008060 [Cordyceps militaris]
MQVYMCMDDLFYFYYSLLQWQRQRSWGRGSSISSFSASKAPWPLGTALLPRSVVGDDELNRLDGVPELSSFITAPGASQELNLGNHAYWYTLPSLYLVACLATILLLTCFSLTVASLNTGRAMSRKKRHGANLSHHFTSMPTSANRNWLK